MGRVCVVVLGDLGRSPRMAYHVSSLLHHGKEVLLVGYGGSGGPPPHPRLTTHHLPPPPTLLARLPRLLSYGLKTVWQAVTLLLALPLLSPLSHVLVQTPPGVPALPVLWLYCLARGSRLVVDFHNYSHTILALATGPHHPLVTLTRHLEGLAGRGAASSLCVTRAMAGDLRDNWGIEATVLHDRPPSQFRPLSASERTSALLHLSSRHPALLPLTLPSPPALLVSSTSWTEDEDFSLLLSALALYEARLEEGHHLPPLLCAITGKGPLKEFYTRRIEKLGLGHVTFVLPWLETEDYPLLLACADLGVSLHTSSSGLDLPMKVVDMFGCCLPVAAMAFPALGELVVQGNNGHVFHDSHQLAEVLVTWFQGFPSSPNPLHATYRANLAEFGAHGWQANWDQVALPVFQEGVRGERGLLPTLLLPLGCLALLSLLLSLLPTVS